MIETIGVLGGGAWGTALALAAARAGRKVRLWARDHATVTAIDETHENPKHLPGIRLEHLPATTSIAVALRADAVILAVPAQAIRAVAANAAPYLRAQTPLIVAAKGLERVTGKRMTEVVAEAAPEAIPAILSGPSFAIDVARGLPTAVTIAAAQEDMAMTLCHALSAATFRPYAETDVTGVEIGGAVKNVLAIACGVVEGLELGQNARSALITRGFTEMLRFGVALGGKPETLNGLCGLGDLVLTCSSTSSRNFSLGKALGEGKSASELMADRRTVAEGAHTAPVLRELARKRGVAMPIVEAVNALLEGADAKSVVAQLLARPLKAE